MNPLDIPFRDIHLPQAVSWWPLAIGWWMIILLPFIFLLLFLLMKKINHRPAHIKTKAKQALFRIENKLKNHELPSDCLADLSILIRRLSILVNHTMQVSSITGEEWLHILDKPLKKPEFSQGIGKLLLTGPYQKNVKKDEVLKLIELCHTWVKKL